ncbi:MAG: RNA 2',3'-cyclic phosphodiesterase [Acidobacteria bacterium]|nr:RNA 2',3'-cyclic phosphodiesterase [Acidobacteriota bacterium]
MRLFTALDLSQEVFENLQRLLNKLRPAARLRWSRPESLHLTLKFIGEWPEEKLEALCEMLQGVPAPAPFEVQVSGVGFFPNAKAPRVFWAGIAACPELSQLAGEVDRALEPLGVAREARPYSPHLTLARIQERAPLDGLHRAIQAIPSLDFGRFTPDRFYLYQSRLVSGGSVYTRIREFPWSR